MLRLASCLAVSPVSKALQQLEKCSSWHEVCAREAEMLEKKNVH
jgi:hypothetical protein